MKKLLFGIVAVVALVVTASAQPFLSQSFMSQSSMNVSNTLGVTNLLSAYGTGTNVDNVKFTNVFGTQIITAAASSSLSNATYLNLVKDCVLWSSRDGFQPIAFAGTNTAHNVQQFGNVSITIVGGSGANAAVTFNFVPVADGVHESTQTADVWSCAVTASTTTVVTKNFNLPIQTFIGCKGIRLRDVVNADTDASSQVTVLSVTLNGFLP